MPPSRYRLFAVTAVAVTCVGASPAVAYAAAPTAPSLTGQVVSNGTGVSGARVTEYAWPTDPKLLQPGKGKAVAMFSLGSAVTNATGSYAIPSTLASLPASYRLTDGSVNLQTYVVTPSGQWSQNQVGLPATETRSTKAGSINNVRWDMSGATILDSDGIHQAAHPGVTQRLHVSTMTKAQARSAIQASTASSASPTQPGSLPYTCVWYDTGGPVILHHEIYGAATGHTNVWGWVDEVESHTNTLELATYEAGRGWTADYSAKVSVQGSGSASTAKHGYTNQHLNSVDMKMYECFTYYHGLYQYPGTYEERPILMAGMNSQERHVSPDWQFAYCQHASAGDTQHQGKNITTTVSSGMSVAGVSLTVTNEFSYGWTSNFQWVTSGEFCGNNSLGVSVSSDIEGDDYYHA